MCVRLLCRFVLGGRLPTPGSILAGDRLVLAFAATLREAVDAMFEFQLGREAPDEDKEAIVAFIRTLAGESEEFSR